MIYHLSEGNAGLASLTGAAEIEGVWWWSYTWDCLSSNLVLSKLSDFF